jgi:uncharacterized YccA/Bax inhibitor family protein
VHRSGSQVTYHVDIMRKHPRSFEISQWTCGILRFIVCQETIVQEHIVAPYGKLIGILLVYAAYDVEVSTRKHHVIVAFVLGIRHLFVWFNVPIVIVFILDRGLVKDLSRADVIVAAETT